jgi:hypothetical protein
MRHGLALVYAVGGLLVRMAEGQPPAAGTAGPAKGSRILCANGGAANSVRLGTCPWRVREEREGSTAVQAGAFIVKGNATIG